MNNKVTGILADVTKVVRPAVTIWLPKKVGPTKDMYWGLNQLIEKYAKVSPEAKDGKLTMIIEFDLPTAVDKIIREENDKNVKQQLEKNGGFIIEQVHKNWDHIFKRW